MLEFILLSQVAYRTAQVSLRHLSQEISHPVDRPGHSVRNNQAEEECKDYRAYKANCQYRPDG